MPVDDDNTTNIPKWTDLVKLAKSIREFDEIVKQILGYRTFSLELDIHEPSDKEKRMAKAFTNQVLVYHGTQQCYAQEDVLGLILCKDSTYDLFDDDNGWGYTPHLSPYDDPHPGGLSQDELTKIELNRIQNMLKQGKCRP